MTSDKKETYAFVSHSKILAYAKVPPYKSVTLNRLTATSFLMWAEDTVLHIDWEGTVTVVGKAESFRDMLDNVSSIMTLANIRRESTEETFPEVFRKVFEGNKDCIEDPIFIKNYVDF